MNVVVDYGDGKPKTVFEVGDNIKHVEYKEQKEVCGEKVVIRIRVEKTTNGLEK